MSQNLTVSIAKRRTADVKAIWRNLTLCRPSPAI